MYLNISKLFILLPYPVRAGV